MSFQIEDSSLNLNADIVQRPARTSEDFYLFCQFILEHENYYEADNKNELAAESHGQVTDDWHVNNNTNTGDITTNEKTEMSDEKIHSASNDSLSTNDEEDSDIDPESYNLVTCYCGKPYAARPMIECSSCLTWLHFSCAKIKRKNIPEIFICTKCIENNDASNQLPKRKKPVSNTEEEEEEEEEDEEEELEENETNEKHSPLPNLISIVSTDIDDNMNGSKDE